MEGSPTWICDWSMAGVCHSSLASTNEAALFTTQCSLNQGGEVSRGHHHPHYIMSILSIMTPSR